MKLFVLVAAFPLVAFGGGRGRTLLDEVGCVGDEDRLEYCMRNPIGEHNCDSAHTEDAGVLCSSGISYFKAHAHY